MRYGTEPAAAMASHERLKLELWWSVWGAVFLYGTVKTYGICFAYCKEAVSDGESWRR
jgi:hypothetical protein